MKNCVATRTPVTIALRNLYFKDSPTQLRQREAGDGMRLGRRVTLPASALK